MFLVILLLLQLPSVSGRTGQAVVSEATARTVVNDFPPSNVLDGDSGTFYHSSEDNQPEWLKLTLDRGLNYVTNVVILNRYSRTPIYLGDAVTPPLASAQSALARAA